MRPLEQDLASLKGSLAAAIDALHQATSTEAVDQLSKAVTAGLQADLAARVLPGFQAGVDDALATLQSSLERLTQMVPDPLAAQRICTSSLTFQSCLERYPGCCPFSRPRRGLACVPQPAAALNGIFRRDTRCRNRYRSRWCCDT